MKKLALFPLFLLAISFAAGQGVDVTEFHNDHARTGQNLNETTLAPGNVNPLSFGKLFSYPVDGFVYAQPLYLSANNTVFVATEHDSVYAFDASGHGLLWKRSFIDPAHGITTVPAADVGPNNTTDLVPEIGITATPAIDASGGILYVEVKTKEVRADGNHYVHKLHALDVTTGDELINPAGQVVADTLFSNGQYIHAAANPCVPGTGQDSQAGKVCFNGLRQLVRPGLTLLNGVIYLASASHGDNTPYHGWVLGYDSTTLQLVTTFNTTPNGGLGGIWESGDPPAFDADGSMYVVTGNGSFHKELDPTLTMYGDSIIKLSTGGGLNVVDFFTPFDQASLNSADADQGSGGIMVLPDQPGDHPHLLLQTGKRGKIYLLDRDHLGDYRQGPGCSDEPILETCDNVYQFAPNGTIGASFDTPAYFNDSANQYIYYGGVGNTIRAFPLLFDASRNGVVLSAPAAFQTTASFGFPGTTPAVTANGTQNAIVWAINNNGYGIPARPQPSPAILFAFDASNLSTLYSSDLTGKRDELGSAVKFTTPTIADGRVFVGTQNSLEVLGLFDVAGGPPSAPVGLAAMSGPPAPAPPSITLTWTNTATNATGIKIERSADGTNFLQVSTVGRNESSYTDTGVMASFTYFYRVRATNQVGDSDPSNIASARTHIAAPVLRVSDICANNVVLAWTSTADGHYDVARSLDGTSFTTIATVAAPTTTYTDSGLSFGTYFYRITAVNTDGDQTNSNVMSATVGPVTVSHGSGFAGAKDITVNGSANFTGNKLEITTGDFGQAGSAYANTQVGIRKFTTSFVYQAVPGTTPMADGLTFIIQGNSPMSLGASGGGMAFLNVGKSVAIKFDLFNHGHGGWSTGQYVDGHNPDTPQAGEADINLVGTPIDLTSGHPFKVDISYDGTFLIEKITDTITGGSFTIDDYPPIDIPAHVGGDTAFVGFGGGTGGLSAVQDILSWTFTPDESGLPPRRPSNLAITGTQQVDATHFNVSLGWKCNNAFTATGFKVEKSTDGTNFSQIAQLPVSQTTYTDMGLTAGQYFYRLRSFNASGNSAYTAAVCVPVGGPTVNHGSGFSCHDDLTANGTAAFVGSPNPVIRLTNGNTNQTGSAFSNNLVDIRKFTTTFKLQLTNPNADGMTFALQPNSPTALSTLGGGGLGYGADTPGGPRGIRNSIAIKFDIFDNVGEGVNSTGLFSDGRSPTVPEAGSGDVLVNLNGTGIDLHSGHVFQVDLNYDGAVLTEKITDTTTSASFTTSYTVDIVSKVRGNTAFAGFTGATGGLAVTSDVQTWTFQSLP